MLVSLFRKTKYVVGQFKVCICFKVHQAFKIIFPPFRKHTFPPAQNTVHLICLPKYSLFILSYEIHYCNLWENTEILMLRTVA
jgi:hypothetical protein